MKQIFRNDTLIHDYKLPSNPIPIYKGSGRAIGIECIRDVPKGTKISWTYKDWLQLDNNTDIYFLISEIEEALEKESKAEELTLPEHWCIRVQGNTEGHIRNKQNNAIFEWRKIEWYADGFIHSGEYKIWREAPRGVEITFEQFQTHVLKQTPVDKRIIGYRTPYTINARIPKGTVYEDGRTINKSYCPEGRHGQGSEWYLPPEIVEQWEPVYEKVITSKRVNVGSRNTKVTVHKDGKVEFRNTSTGILNVKNLRASFEVKNLMIAEYELSLEKFTQFIRIGCTNENNLFSLHDLDLIIDTHKELQKS